MFIFTITISVFKPGRTIATSQRNILQYCRAQHVVCVWPSFQCDMLRHAGCCWLKLKNGQIWANSTQHVATGWPNARNMLRPTMLQCVALALRSFGRGIMAFVLILHGSWIECHVWLLAHILHCRCVPLCLVSRTGCLYSHHLPLKLCGGNDGGDSMSAHDLACGLVVDWFWVKAHEKQSEISAWLRN